jgi:hypothetical protein
VLIAGNGSEKSRSDGVWRESEDRRYAWRWLYENQPTGV